MSTIQNDEPNPTWWEQALEWLKEKIDALATFLKEKVEPMAIKLYEWVKKIAIKTYEWIKGWFGE